MSLITNKQDVLKGCGREWSDKKYSYAECSRGFLCSFCQIKKETLNYAIDEQIKLLKDFIEQGEKLQNDVRKDYPCFYWKYLKELTTQLNDLIKAREDDT